MSMLRRVLNRWRERTLASEFEEEIAFHLEERVARNVRAGMDPEAARTEARRHFGNVMLAREDMRKARVASWVDDFACDLRHAVRMFGRQPLLTGIAVLTLSLGIGANAAIYSVLNALLFRPLAFPQANRTVMVTEQVGTANGTSPTIPEILDLRARTRSLEAVTFFDTRDAQIAGGTEPERVLAARVDPVFLPLLGARPARGRLFTESDSAQGSTPVVLLSDGLWRRNFGGAPDAVGRTIVVNGESCLIAGVLPEDFTLGFLSAEPIEIYLPYPLIPLYTLRSGEFANVRRVVTLARVRPEVSPEAVSADLSSVAASLVAEHPRLYADAGGVKNFSLSVRPLREVVGAAGRSTFFMLFGAVFLVLLIACVNAAQFLLSHAIDREPEVALRSALGAGRARLVRQFLSETFLLAGSAAALGIAQAIWLLDVVRSLLPPMLMVGTIDLDIRVLGFIAAAALGTTILCGLAPSLRFSRPQVSPGLRLDARGGSSPRGRARHILIAIEVALSVVLLVQAALLIRTLSVLSQAQTGFSPESVLTMRIRGMASPGQSVGTVYQQYVEAIAHVPDVAAAAISSSVLPGRPGTPFSAFGSSDSEAARSAQTTSYQIVSPDYFSVLGIPLRQGRTFAATDTAATSPVAVINEEMATRLWPGDNPIGRRIRSGIGPRDATMTIVGVAGNVRPPLQSGDVPQLYVSYRQQSEANMLVLVRPVAGTAAPVDAVKRAIWSVEPRQAVFNIRPIEEILEQSVQRHRIVASILGSFAALASIMSIAGVFAVISSVISRRVKEIAVRRAIGAQSADVLRLLAGPTLAWAAIGCLTGAGSALFATGAVRAAVPGVIPLDPLTFVVTGAGYLFVVAFATILPGIRALRVDPATTLRVQ
jgi:predicted permease